jgi:hypothetical protein
VGQGRPSRVWVVVGRRRPGRQHWGRAGLGRQSGSGEAAWGLSQARVAVGTGWQLDGETAELGRAASGDEVVGPGQQLAERWNRRTGHRRWRLRQRVARGRGGRG